MTSRDSIRIANGNGVPLKRFTRMCLERGKRKGSVIVLAALVMVALLGFCALGVDYGLLVATKNQLQRACDAAALAGASELPASDAARTDAARYQGELVAYRNGVPTNESDVSFPSTARIQVTATRNVKAMFGRAVGIISNNVSAVAVAGRSPLKGINGVVPLAITIDDYNTYKDGRSFSELLIDNNRQDFKAGTMTALDLRPDNNGKSGAVFQDDLTTGYSGQILIGQQINNTLNAALNSQSAKLQNALDARFARALGLPWLDAGNELKYQFPNYPSDDPRVVPLIVADPNGTDNSNPKITARFFVPVYIQSYKDMGKGEFSVSFRILPRLSYSADNPDITLGDESTPDTGIGVIRLFS